MQTDTEPSSELEENQERVVSKKPRGESINMFRTIKFPPEHCINCISQLCMCHVFIVILVKTFSYFTQDFLLNSLFIQKCVT